MSPRDGQEPHVKSIIARLGNAHRERNAASGTTISRSEVFTLYAIERVLYRIGRSAHSKRFVLKGGMLAGALFDNPWRATRDADLLGPGKRPSVRRIRSIFEEIADIDTWAADGIRVERVRAMRAQEDGPDGYNGVKVLLDVSVGGTAVTVQVDVGFGDGVVPRPQRITLPPLLPREVIEPASVYAYPIEAFIAEKAETLLSKFPAIAHRLKDFVDIYVAVTTRSFEGLTAMDAFRASFTARRSPYRPDTLAAFVALPSDRAMRQEWSKMLKEKRIAVPLPDMRDVVGLVIAFVEPLLAALAHEGGFTGPGGLPPRRVGLHHLKPSWMADMNQHSTYRVTYDRDEEGWWIARVHGVAGVHSNGRTIEEARRRVREALSLAVDDADDALFEEEGLRTGL